MTAAAMTRLEVTAASLAGTTLIEANAGTGKTWTITALYVRLLLEAGCKVDQILVVTFTEVATAELRDRIRKRLVETRAALERGTASEGDALVAALLARFPDRTQVLHDLEDALANFDQAPIYTIHGFCQRALGDWAFETAMPFKTELVPDPSEILQEIVEDFWRNELHGASPLFTGYLVQQKVDPGCLQKDVRSWIGKPHLVFRGPDEAKDIAALETRYSEAWREAQAIWLRARNEVQKQLVTSTGLHAGKYKRASIPQWIEEMDACLAPRNPGVLLCHQFEKFTPEALERATNRGGRTPRHAFYDACGALKATHDALMPAYAARLARMKMRLVEYCNAELATRKKARQLQSFDDLLLNLHDALHDHRAPKLVEALRVRYSAALIDEFQDTDPVQYEIFKRIYADSGRPVFLVGDPKQSIYSFRGADVFAYLNARRDAQNSHTLDRNWRSAPGLLEAVNLIFSTAPTPFVFEDIPFHRSYPAQGDRGRFVIEGELGAPLELWYLQSEDGKPITKGAACDMGARATAAEIARLMNLGERKQARIVERKDGIVRERRLCGGDIAVLVRSHRQGKIVRDALAACGVSSVQRGSENVFSSVEAEELERVLLAIAEPGRETRVSAALTTEIMGYSGERLHAAQADEGQWEPLVESFREAQRDWHEHGFIRMLRAFFKRHGVVCRLLEYGDGERRVTNLLHLSERLHCEADTHGASGLIAWLAAKRRAAGSENEEELLRLESDENLVKILTVHVAKGLEFPLVFCPFLWDLGSRSAKKDVITFHDADDGFGQVIDFGSDELEISRAQATREELAENLRLMYVALTRAKYRCWMAWGPVADAHTSAPAWLLHRQQLSLSPSSGDGGREGKQEHALSPSRGEGGGEGKLEPGRMLAELQELAASSAGTIRVTPLEPPAP
ncbi:MAG: UvrD-helicase domain-containing protein, partial [Burkholderiales bacterium]